MSNEYALPERPNLEQLRKQAREHQRSHPGLTLTEAKRDLARLYGFASWTKLKSHVEEVLGLRTHLASYVDAALAGRLAQADEILEEHPELRTLDVVTLITGGGRITESLDPNEPLGPKEWPPLLYVCFSRYHQRPENAMLLTERARELLHKGADPNSFYKEPAYPDSDETCLYGAVGLNSNTELTRLLLQHGANPDDNEALYHGTEHANHEPLRLILEAGGPPKGNNVVAHMLDREDLAGLRLVLEHYGEPDEDLLDVMHHAIIRSRSVASLKLLVEYGSDPNHIRNGMTPYGHARLLGERAAADYLALIGADLSLTPEQRAVIALVDGDPVPDGVTVPVELQWPLSDAAGKGLISAVTRMLDAGFDPNVRAGWGRTGLHQAATAGYANAVLLLLQRGADISITDPHHNATALGFALFSADFSPNPQGDYASTLRVLFEAGGAKYITAKWAYDRTERHPEFRRIVENYVAPPSAG